MEQKVTRFCNSCGNPISVNGRFCPGCGTKLAVNEPVVPAAQPRPSEPASFGGRSAEIDSMREEALAELDRMYQWFLPKKGEYDELMRLNNLIPAYSGVKSRALVIAGGIVAGLGLFTATVFQHWIPLAVGVVIGGPMIAGFVLLNVKRKRTLAETRAKLSDLANRLHQHYLNYGKCILSEEYVYPDDIATYYKVIQDGRADSIKEALRVVADDERANEMLSLQRQTAANAGRAARAATASAIIGGVNLARNLRR